RDADRVEPGIDSTAQLQSACPSIRPAGIPRAAPLGTHLAKRRPNEPGLARQGDDMKSRPTTVRIALLAACAALATPALAADPAPMTRAEERAYRADLETERERLEQALSRVTDRADFAGAIEAEGYRLA